MSDVDRARGESGTRKPLSLALAPHTAIAFSVMSIMEVLRISQNRCPDCMAPFVRGRVMTIGKIKTRLDFCPLCGGYCKRTVSHDSLITPFEEIVKTHRFRRIVDAGTDFD